MEPLLLVIFGITLLFVLILVIKRWLPKSMQQRACAICIAVSGTWLLLLVFRELGFFSDGILLGLLIGQSITGIFYLAEKTVREELTLFRLPFLLTLLVLGYGILTRSLPTVGFIIVAAVWAILGLTYTFKQNPRLKQAAKAMIECCKRW